jgi:GTP-binding protein
MFVDEVQVHLQAGHGGRGCLAFRREKRVPRGGPSGGDGGHGGSIYIVANPHTSTLINYRFHPEFDAEKGQHGQGSNRTGHNGKDLELSVPLGTLVYEKSEDPNQPDQLVADLAHEGDRVLIAKGGRGGMGNARFATATNRAPRKVQPGEPGEEKFIRLELKLLADVGLVGFPNAGKSTLISRISAARPKIADYPFTTLTPNLGVVGLSGDRSFVVADVPGLIEGAHRGLGLGHQFLRHLERTKVLVHLVDLSSMTARDPVDDLDVLRRELELFAPTLAAKPQVVAANKIDALDDEERAAALERRAGELGLPFYRISAVSGAGLPELLEEMWRQVAAARAVEAAEIEIDRNAGEGSNDRAGMGSDRIPDDLSERRDQATGDGAADAAADAPSNEHTDDHIPTR